jgi:deoxyhypusine synthase
MPKSGTLIKAHIVEAVVETSGYPTRDTLKSLDLAYVADELEKHGKLGKS